MDSDSSSYYQTTYSEDERYEECLREKKRKKLLLENEIALQREVNFQTFYEESSTDPDSIFNLAGVHFLKFCSKKIKFSFQPCRVAKMVNQRVMFYISFKYVNHHWRVRRDSIPVDYKMKVYSLFYTNGSFRFDDDNICDGIREIWSIFVKWAAEEHKYRKRKFQRFRKGEDLFIDRDDEDLFLSDSEVEELHRKREEIWQRMLPPPAQRRRLRMRI